MMRITVVALLAIVQLLAGCGHRDAIAAELQARGLFVAGLGLDSNSIVTFPHGVRDPRLDAVRAALTESGMNLTSLRSDGTTLLAFLSKSVPLARSGTSPTAQPSSEFHQAVVIAWADRSQTIPLTDVIPRWLDFWHTTPPFVAPGVLRLAEEPSLGAPRSRQVMVVTPWPATDLDPSAEWPALRVSFRDASPAELKPEIDPWESTVDGVTASQMEQTLFYTRIFPIVSLQRESRRLTCTLDEMAYWKMPVVLRRFSASP